MSQEHSSHITGIEAIFDVVQHQPFPDIKVNQLREAIAFALRGGVISAETIRHQNTLSLAEAINEYWRQEEIHDHDRFPD